MVIVESVIDLDYFTSLMHLRSRWIWGVTVYWIKKCQLSERGSLLDISKLQKRRSLVILWCRKCQIKNHYFYDVAVLDQIRFSQYFSNKPSFNSLFFFPRGKCCILGLANDESSNFKKKTEVEFLVDEMIQIKETKMVVSSKY